ncbi:MAG: glycosyltransferase [Actinobacteria bacterium]|nr:glycosyltransferase [Actinomycetota bacterium]
MQERSTGADAPAISAVICTYTSARWELLVRAIDSLRRQQCSLLEIIVVIDHNEVLLSRMRQEMPDVVVIPNEGKPGLSAARNSGMAAARGAVVAWLDDDAEAARDWSARLRDDFSDPAVIGVGCSIIPRWEAGKPGWFPAEFNWVVGCTYRGVPTTKQAIRNPLGAAMALRKDALDAVEGFSSDLGRFQKNAAGCEETELCVRLRQHNPEWVVIQDPTAFAKHFVPVERTTWRYFRSRCFAEGLSKASVSRSVGSTDALRAERSYVARALPAGVLRGLLEALRGDASGLLRSVAIMAGLSWTAGGFVVGSLRSRGGRRAYLDAAVRGNRRLAKQAQ